MPTSLAHPLAQTPPAAPLGTLQAERTSHGDEDDTVCGMGYGTLHGRTPHDALADPEGGSDRQEGGVAKQGPSLPSPALIPDHTQSVYPVTLDRESDGRFIAEVSAVPGALAYGRSPEEAARRAQAIAREPSQPHTQSVSLTVYFAMPLVPGINAREHHMVHARRVKRERLATAWALQAAGIPHGLAPCRVTLTRHAKNRLDSDNLQGAFKAVRDAVAQWLNVDDRSEAIEWRYGDRYEGGASCVRIEFSSQARIGGEV